MKDEGVGDCRSEAREGDAGEVEYGVPQEAMFHGDEFTHDEREGELGRGAQADQGLAADQCGYILCGATDNGTYEGHDST